MKPRPALILPTVVIAVIALPLVFWGALKHARHLQPPQVVEVKARDGATSSTIVAEGSIIPQSIIDVGLEPGIEGVVSHLFVDVGQHVTHGQVLAEVSSDVEQQHVVQADSSVSSALSHYNLVLHPFRPEEIAQMQLKVEGDKDSCSEEQDRLSVLQQGNRPEEIAQAQSNADSAKARLTLAQSSSAQDQQLYAGELISRSDLDANQTALTVAQDEYDNAQQALTLAQTGPRPEEVAEQKTAVQRAKTVLASDIEQYKIMTAGPRSDELREAAATLTSAQSNANEQNLIYSHRYVRAPISGVVTARNMDVGEMASSDMSHTSGVEPLVSNRSSMFAIRSDAGVQFIANIDQLFYNEVGVGQHAAVSVESLPGRSFDGVITKVTPMINSDLGQRRGSTSSVNPLTPFTFNVWVRVNGAKDLLVPGQVGQIQLQRVSHGLLVPEAAITSFSLGSGTVYVEKDGIVKVRSVRYDETTDGQMRVLSGLSAGDNVVVSQTSALHDGMRVTPEMKSVSDLGSLPQSKVN